jgi:OmpA-OmpF porin, OOP family
VLRYVVSSTVLLLADPALARPDTGFYLEGNLGYSHPDSVDARDGAVKGEVELGDTAVFGGALGYKFPWFRLEANVSYRENDIDKVRVEGFDFNSNGDTKALVGLVNGIIDIDIDFPVRPYFGGGIGGAYLKLNTGSGMPFEIDDNTGTFAWDLLAGLGWDVTESVALTITYRYLRLEGTDFSASVAGVDDGNVDVDAAALHEVLVGLRYTF